jgi:hypothetical protein
MSHFVRMPASKPKEKYSRERTSLDGYSFASKLEAALYQTLKLMERAGELQIKNVQDHVLLSKAEIKYIPDFKVWEPEQKRHAWHEAKGFETEKWPLIKKLWAAYGPGPLYIWKGTYRQLNLVERIIPKGEP